MTVSLSVREIRRSDIDHIVRYWTGCDKTHLLNMGVDASKLPAGEQIAQTLSAQIDLPVQEKRSYCIIWEADGKPLGHCNTNPTIFGEEAYMHLHMWDPKERKRGLGMELVKMTIPYFFENLRLKKLICEPYALNPAPNRTLERSGFELVKEYITIPNPLSFEQPVKRWEMSYEKYKRS